MAVSNVDADKGRRLVVREVSGQVLVFLSTIAVNAAAFVVLFLASLKLAGPEFAKLSLAVGLVSIVASVLDLGSNQSCLKLSFETGDARFLGFNLALKSLFLVLLLPAAGLAYLLGLGFDRVAIGAAGAGMAFWGAMRLIEQRRREFHRLSLLNFSVAISRLVFGVLSLISQNISIIILSLFVFSQIPANIMSFGRARQILSSASMSDSAVILRLSPFMFASGLLYSSLPVVTQYMVYATGDVSAASAMGIVVMFLAPLSIVATTLRVYILPDVLSQKLGDVRLFGASSGNLAWCVGLLLVALIAASGLGTVLVQMIYHDRFPEAGLFFLIYFGATAVALPVGLLNVRAQRGALVRIEVVVNAARFAATAALALWGGLSPVAIVAASAAILVTGELVLAALLTLSGDRSANSGARPRL